MKKTHVVVAMGLSTLAGVASAAVVGATPIPEPGMWALFGVGAIALIANATRNRRKK